MTELEHDAEARPRTRKFRWSQPLIAAAIFAGLGYGVVASKDCGKPDSETYILDVVRPRADGTLDPTETDRATLRQLERLGSDLSKPTDVRHFVNLADCDRADKVLGQIQAAGFVGERFGDCAVVASHQRVPTLDNLAADRTKLASVIPDGEYAGWEAQLSEGSDL